MQGYKSMWIPENFPELNHPPKNINFTWLNKTDILTKNGLTEYPI